MLPGLSSSLGCGADDTSDQSECLHTALQRECESITISRCNGQRALPTSLVRWEVGGVFRRRCHRRSVDRIQPGEAVSRADTDSCLVRKRWPNRNATDVTRPRVNCVNVVEGYCQAG